MFDSRPDQPRSEPEQAPPYRAEHGPPPVMTTWDYPDQPALEVLVEGRWQYAPVGARANYPDGRVAYHVDIQLPRSGGWTHRAYWWPQEGLRVARRRVR
ncbi:hypothetical protein [Streptomyces niveus]|uniref:hypothetical protein n=1 Tax=Streptomyces niveus TaxID=193462 RepID=UPI0036D285E3